MCRPYSEASRLSSRCFDLHAGRGGDDGLAGDLRQPERLGHLARAGVLAARRAADQQEARRAGRIVVADLGRLDRGAGGDPVLGQVVRRGRRSPARPCGCAGSCAGGRRRPRPRRRSWPARRAADRRRGRGTGSGNGRGIPARRGAGWACLRGVRGLRQAFSLRVPSLRRMRRLRRKDARRARGSGGARPEDMPARQGSWTAQRRRRLANASGFGNLRGGYR